LFLEREGFNNVINLEGGVDRWADEVDPQMQKYR
jgi:rhodanese-related sulfurtransferase